MSRQREFEAIRAARIAARKDLAERLERLAPLRSPKALGQRLRGDVAQHARSAVHQAMEIAGDNRGVLAGTLTALLLWAARKQVFRGLGKLGLGKLGLGSVPWLARLVARFGLDKLGLGQMDADAQPSVQPNHNPSPPYE